MANIWLPDDMTDDDGNPILPSFRPFMTSFYWTLFHGPATAILRALALGIGFLGPDQEDALLDLHSGHYNQLRLLHYPPIPRRAIERGKFARMPAHTDWSTITILFQDDCGGLEVEDPHVPGTFRPVEPVEGSLVLNIGNLMMRWSNGITVDPSSSSYLLLFSIFPADAAGFSPDTLRSTSHRVSLPPVQDRHTSASTSSRDHSTANPGDDMTQNGDEDEDDEDDDDEGGMTRSRYSIPYFITTDPDLVIEAMPCCVDDDEQDGRRGAKYEPITQREYAAMRARMQYS